MLAAVGASSLAELFADVPPELRRGEPLAIPSALSEHEVSERLAALAGRNRTDAVSFLGGGSYDHLIPAVVGSVLGRSEFYTAYTPYQAEMSQGVLQAIFEYQSLICALTGLEVANASLYDGATAACEAASLALNSVRGARRVLFSQALHPHTRRVLATHFSGLEVELVEVPAREGVTDRDALRRALEPGVGAVLVQSPNFLGFLEDLTGLAEEAHARGLSIGLKNDSDQVADLLPNFDWALTEDCFAEGWCEDMLPFIQMGKPVFAAEYTDTGVSIEQICQEATPLNFSLILKNRELDAWRQTCP